MKRNKAFNGVVYKNSNAKAYGSKQLKTCVREDSSPVRSRFLAACLILLAAFVFLFVLGLSQAYATQHQAQVQISDRAVPATLSSWQEVSPGKLESKNLPTWFSEELFYLPHNASYVHEDFGVLSLMVEGDLASVSSEVMQQMNERGWFCVNGSDKYCQSYVRQGGKISWSVISFTQVGNVTTVLVQVS